MSGKRLGYNVSMRKAYGWPVYKAARKRLPVLIVKGYNAFLIRDA